MGISTSLKKLASSAERLSHVSIQGSDRVKASGKAIGNKAKQMAEERRESKERARHHREDRLLALYKDKVNRRRMSELRVYGRELTKKERRKFARFERERKAAQAARPSTLDRVLGPSSKGAKRPAGPRNLRKIDFSLGG